MKKYLGILSELLIIVSLITGVVYKKEKLDRVNMEIKTILIDPGHGGRDNGASYSNILEDENFKLNFRNGTEYVAGLSEMNSYYEMSSEIAHSSPLLIYSNRKFFFYMSIVCMYESFFRIEEILNNIFMQVMSDQDAKSYYAVRQTYLPQLKIILNIEQKKIKK